MPSKSNRQSEEIFSTAHLKSDLKERAVKSTGVTVLAQGAKLVLQITSITVLARLLEPSDFGLVAMVTVFTGLALKFMEGGLSMATIQREEVTHAQVSNLFWVNAGLGLGLCLLSVASAPLVAWVYQEPQVTPVMITLSAVFLVGGLSVQHDAILRRQMRFRHISIIDVTSMALGTAGGILAGLTGFGYWALVVVLVVTYTSQTVMRWWFARWLPSLPSSGTGVRPLLSFGMNLTGANVVGYLTASVTPFVVGLLGGAKAMGFYNRSHAITAIPSSQVLPPVMSVMQAALTRVAQSPERLRRAAISLLSKIAIITMFVTIAMFITADWLVLVLLGNGWEEAVPIFRVLSLATIVTPITTFTAIVLIATGEARALMKWKLITLGILLVAIAIGSYWGVMGVVLAHGLSGFFIRMPCFLAYSTKFQPISIGDYVKALMPSLICASGTLAILMGLRLVYEPQSPINGLLLFGALAAILYMLLCSTFKSVRVEIHDGLKLTRILWAKK